MAFSFTLLECTVSFPIGRYAKYLKCPCFLYFPFCFSRSKGKEKPERRGARMEEDGADRLFVHPSDVVDDSEDGDESEDDSKDENEL